MYYIKISEDEDEEEKNTLIYYCRNCGHENKNITAENVCVSETQLRRSEKKYSQMVNEYTKYDPTLPRINTIKCPNHECISNNESQAGGSGQMGNVGGGRPTKAEAAAKAAAKAEAEASGIPLPTIKKPRTTKLKPTAEQKEKIQKALGKQSSAASAASQATAASQVSAQQKEEEALAQIMEEQEQEEEELEAAAKTYLASAQKETVVGPIATENDHNNREIIYLRYDDINMKYIYLCVHCNTVWKTDNRQ